MKNTKSRLFKNFGIVLALSILLAISTAVAMAAPYPTKPVRLIVPYPPGGSADIVGRLIAAKLSERLGKQVVVENHAGAGSIIGTEIVAKADPDGYTLLLATASHATIPALQKAAVRSD